ALPIFRLGRGRRHPRTHRPAPRRGAHPVHAGRSRRTGGLPAAVRVRGTGLPVVRTGLGRTHARRRAGEPPSADTVERSRPGQGRSASQYTPLMIRTGVSALGWVLLVAGGLASAGLLVLRLVPELHTWHHLVIAAASFIPLLWVPALAACLGLILVLRERWRLVGAAVLIAAVAVFAWPLLPQPETPDVPVAHGSVLTVLSPNLPFGRADVEEVAALVTDEVDVLALQ